MQKTMTITLDEAVYDDLINVIGREKMSQFFENLARPYVAKDNLTLAYREMAADTQREDEALEWCNSLIGDFANEAR